MTALLHKTDFDWSTDLEIGDFYASDTTISFDIAATYYDRDESGAAGADVTARVVGLHIGMAQVNRDALAGMIGNTDLAALEKAAATAWWEAEGRA